MHGFRGGCTAIVTPHRSDPPAAAIAPAEVLPGDLPLDRAIGAVLAQRRPICAVRSGARWLGLLEQTVRCAWQDDRGTERPIAELARADLVVDDAASATRRLAHEPRLPAVLVGPDASGAVHVAGRTLPPVRTAIVMAGGFGKRLRPLTETTPKPLLDVGGRPLLARILDLLQKNGVERVHVSVHYRAEQVEALVGDGSAWGMRASYLREAEPLGTGAGLALLGRIDEPFFVMNGDILTNTDLRALAREHLLADNLATVATFRFPAPLPYGVVHHDGARIARIEEKPVFRYPVNAGIYAFAPRALELVKPGAPLAMVDFLNANAPRERIGRFALVEYWNDVGSHEDYLRAQEDVHDL